MTLQGSHVQVTSQPSGTPVTGSLTTQTPGVGNTTASPTGGYAAALISVTGTYSATMAFEVTDDPAGTTWYATQGSRIADGTAEASTGALVSVTRAWTVPTPGMTQIRLRCTTFVSGTVAVRVTPTVLASAGGGGGGVSSTVTANAGTNLNTSLLALEAGGNLASLNTNLPAKGQALAASSLPVVLTAAQVTTLTPPAALTNFSLETGGNLAAISGGTGATADAIVAAGAVGSLSAKLRRATQGLEDLKTLIVLAAGSAIIGKVGIDQTTPGTTNAVQANAGTNLNTSTLSLEAGHIASVDTNTGAVADAIVAAGATGSLSAKLRRVTQGLEDLKTLIVLGAGSALIGKVGIDQTAPGTTNAVSATGNVADAGTDSGNPVKAGALYKVTQPTYTDGQRTTLYTDNRGSLLSNPRLLTSADAVTVYPAPGQPLAVNAQLYDSFSVGLRTVTPTSGINLLQVNTQEYAQYANWNASVINVGTNDLGTFTARNIRKFLFVINVTVANTGILFRYQTQDGNGTYTTLWSQTNVVATGQFYLLVGDVPPGTAGTGWTIVPMGFGAGTSKWQIVIAGTSCTITGTAWAIY